jgi:hypothetical protein
MRHDTAPTLGPRCGRGGAARGHCGDALSRATANLILAATVAAFVLWALTVAYLLYA